MNRSTFNKAVVPGLFAFMINGYKKKAAQSDWRLICDVRPSKRAYEEAAYAAGLGLFAHKPEGEAINYDDLAQGPLFGSLLKSNFKVIKKTISGNALWGNSEERLLCTLN